MKKLLASVLLAALAAFGALGPTTPMPGLMHPGGENISGSDITPDSVNARTGVFGSITDSGDLNMPNQSTGYLVKNPNSETIESQQCTAEDVAGYVGGGSTSLQATVAGPSMFASGGAGGYIQTTADGVVYNFPESPNNNLIFSGTYGLGRYVFVGTTTADSVTGSTSTDGVTWTSFKGNFTSGQMGAVACGLVECVMVGNASRVQRTTDFTTFTNGTFGGASVTIWGVAYSPSLSTYVAVGASGTIKTSIDGGLTWTAQTSGVATTLYGVTRSVPLALFVAVGAGGVILTSADGVTWVPRTSGTTADLFNAIDGNGTVVVTGDSLKIITSTNGTSWTVRSTGVPSSQDLYQSAYLSGTYLVAGESGIQFLSSDAVTWTRGGALGPGCVDKGELVAEYLANDEAKTINGQVTFGQAPKIPSLAEGLYYQVHPDSPMVTIPNGPTGQSLVSRGEGLRPDWENPAAISAFTTGSDLVSNPVLANPLARFVHVSDTTWITDGGGFFESPVADNDSSRFMRVSDVTGDAWTNLSAISANNLMGAAYGDNKWVVGGGNRTLAYSADLSSWTTITPASTCLSGATNRFDFLSYVSALGLFVGGGNVGNICSSPDGVTWTNRVATGANVNYNSAAWDGTTLVIVSNVSSDIAGLATSTNGTSYTVTTANSVPSGGGAAWRGVAYVTHVDDTFVAAGAAGVVFNSTTGLAGSWFPQTSGISTDIGGLANNGSRVVMVGTGGVIRTSDDKGVTWTGRTSGTSIRFTNVIWTGSYFIATGLSGVAVKSLDGITWTLFSNGSTRFDALAYNSGVVLNVGNVGALRTTTNAMRTIVYASDAARTAGTPKLDSADTGYDEQPETVTIAGQVEFDVDGVDPTDLPLDFDILRGFKSTVYESSEDRTDGVDALGDTMYAYSGTPLVVDIPLQLAFNVAILTPADVPFDFDVVTIQDIIYNLFSVQNTSLPNPYYCYGCDFDYGPDMRFEFTGTGQYAATTRFNAATGNFKILVSTVAGNAGDAVVFDTVAAFRTGKKLDFIARTQYVRQTFSNTAATVDSLAQFVAQIGTMSASRVLTLPAASSYLARRAPLCIADESGSVTGGNTIVITRAGSDLINGATTNTINAAYASRCLVSDGVSKWTVVSSSL